MEALNSAPLGAMGSLLRKLDKLMMEAKNSVPNIRQLRDDVGTISNELVKLSEVHDPPLTVNYWMKEARELSYDMEDCVDQFLHARSDTEISWTDEISGFRTRVEEVIERYHRFKLQYVLGRSAVTNTVASHRIGMAYRDPNTVASVGMEGPKNELLRWLKPKIDDENELQQVKVVSIFGVEGIGKSTLVQELWHILGEEFECQAFVQLSKKPDMRMILRSILLQVCPHKPPEACQVPNLIHKIWKHLQDKRYFIIIDDLWAVSAWDTISRAFPEGNCSSRIITTTTIEDVALACCSYDPEHIFKMRYLSCQHSKELFLRTVFGSGKECPQQFHDVSDEITRKCGGLPLAITCIASLLANQPEIVHKWEYVQNSLRDNLRVNPTSVEILKQVLNLCYYSLPHCLKTCLLYCSIYPENYIILKEDLVKQWMAEGFISAAEEKDIAKVASSYFDEMVSLGLIQRMNIGCNKKGVPYVVHPLVFEFIKCLSTEDNFITVIDYSQSTVALTEKIRRLSLQFGSATYATAPACIGHWKIRSLSFMGLLTCMPALTDFELVRVIILHVLVDNGDTSFSLTGIHGLLFLRYLQVRCNVTVELPNQIGRLEHLETLEIHARVTVVPEDIVHLPRLLHLRLGRKRYRYHKHPIVSNLPSGKASSLDDSSRASSSPVPVRLFGSPDMLIPRPPRWVGHFRNLCYLDVVVSELQTYDIDALGELWALTVLLLYVRTTPAGDIYFKRGAFQVLRYFRYICCGVMLLTFDKEAMPNLWRLNIGFNAHRGEKYGHLLAGIQHLLNLQEVSASIGAAFSADESDRKTAQSAFQEAISTHPCLPSLKIKMCDRIGENDPSGENWIHLIQRGQVVKKQHGLRKQGMPNDQPGGDMKKHAETRARMDTGDKKTASRHQRLGPIDAKWQEVKFVKDYALFMGYLPMALTGTCILILMWSTVAILGGSATLRAKKDFWSLTVITPVQTRVFESVKGIWHEWKKIHCLTLLSFFLQVLTFLKAGMRNRSSWWVVRIILWLAYLLADSVTIYALGGLMSHTSEPSRNLMSFWVPFLLVHLGRQDNITAFSKEDNDLWPRHLLVLALQVGIAGFVVAKASWADGWLRAATVLMFLSGCFKCSERAICLFAWSTAWPRLPSGGIEAEGIKAFVIDIMSTDAPLRVLRTTTVEKKLPVMPEWKLRGGAAYEFVGASLEHCYQYLYTKNPVRYTIFQYLYGTNPAPRIFDSVFSLGVATLCLLFSLFSYVATPVALVLFAASKKGDHHSTSRADITVSYILLVGTIVLDVSLLVANYIQPAWCRKKWSQELAQYSMIKRQGMGSVWRWIGRNLSFGGIELFDVTRVSLSEDIKEFILDQLVGCQTRKEWNIAGSRGQLALQKWRMDSGQAVVNPDSSIHRSIGGSVDFPTSVLIWHIATDMCYYWKVQGSAHSSGDQVKKHKEMSRKLSNYIMYLVFKCGVMLTNLSQLEHDRTRAKTGSTLLQAKLREDEAVTYLRERIAGIKDRSPVLHHAYEVALELMSIDDETQRWGLITSVWSEMLYYTAPRCGATFHYVHLATGGEFVTHVLLLMKFLGA